MVQPLRKTVWSFLKKTKNRMSYDPAVPLLNMHIPMQNYNLKRYMYPYGLPCYLSWQRIHLQCKRRWFDSWVRKIPWRMHRLPILVFLGFPGGSDRTEFTCNVGDLGLIPGLGKSPGGGHDNPCQYSCLENLHGQKSLAHYSP